MIALFFTLNLGFAADPNSGSLAPTNGAAVSWNGASTTGANLDESTCVEGVTCDSFTLNLTGAATDYANLVLSIQIAWKVGANDYDLYVHKGDLSGPVVA